MDTKQNKKKIIGSALGIGFFLIAGLALALPAWQINKQKISEGPRLSNPQVLGESIENFRGVMATETKEQPFKNNSEKIDFKKISSASFMVIDEPTGTILLEKQPYLKLPIASLTKLMTGLLAYETLNPETFKKIEPGDVLAVNPSLGFKAGEEIKILDLLESMLVCSANDAAKALANLVENNSGKNFAFLMNQKAKTLGLSETSFSNPIGFDSDFNYSNAADLKTLVYYTQSMAVFRNLVKRAEVRFTSKSGRAFYCQATNRLLMENYEIESIKTGYTKAAKGSIIARVKEQGKSILIIVVGSDNREKDLISLAEFTFKAFSWN